MISIRKASLGMQILPYSCCILSGLHRCDMLLCIELPIPGALTTLLLAGGAQGNSCHSSEPGSSCCPHQTVVQQTTIPQRLGKPRTCCVQMPWEPGSLHGECQVHQPCTQWHAQIVSGDSDSALLLGRCKDKNPTHSLTKAQQSSRAMREYNTEGAIQMVLGHCFSGNSLAFLQLSCPAETLNKLLFPAVEEGHVLFFSPKQEKGGILPPLAPSD